jgi:hypothetical protein
MPPKTKLAGVKISFHVLNDSEVIVDMELDDETPEDTVPELLVNLISYVRSDEGLAAVIKIFKKACKSLDRKDLYRTFTILLKTMALQILVDKNEPMISPMEVLGKKRMS